MTAPRILFFAEGATLAHAVRPIECAKGLAKAGLSVHYAVPAEYFELVSKEFKGTPIKVHELHAQDSMTFLKSVRSGARLYRLETLFEYVDADRKLIQEVKPQVLIGEFRPSLSTSAQLENIPVVTLCNAYWSPKHDHSKLPVPVYNWNRFFSPTLLSPVFNLGSATVLAFHLAPFNQLRRHFKLAPFASLYDAFSAGDVTLYTDSRALFPDLNQIPPTQFLGPLTWSPDTEAPSWFHAVKDQGYAYVCLGSSGNQAVLPQLVDAVDALGLTAVVSSSSNKSAFHKPPLSYCDNILPGTLLAKHARLMICNGGSLSVYQGLRVGCPVVGICSNMDQLLCMRAAEKSAAAFSVRSSPFSRHALSVALTSALNKTAKDAATRLANCFEAESPSENLLLALNTLLGSNYRHQTAA